MTSSMTNAVRSVIVSYEVKHKLRSLTAETRFSATAQSMLLSH